MERLVDCYAPVFSLGLELGEQLASGQQYSVSVEEAQQKLITRLELAEKVAADAGHRDRDIKESSFAAVAWLDEIFSQAGYRTSDITPLQVALFSTANAGDEFFERLERLTPDQDQVREVYFMAMGLGLVGRYYDDAAELARIVESTGRQLPDRPAVIHRLAEEHVIPQPYLSDDPGPPRVPKQWDKIILRLATLLAVLVPLSLLIYFWMQQPEQKPDRKEVDMDEVQRILDSFQCAQLSGILIGQDEVVVKGHLATDDDLVRIELIGSVEGVGSVASEVDVLVWPFCEVVEILEPYQRLNREQQRGLRLALHEHSTNYREGEKLILEIAAPDHDAYLYVDYYPVPEGERSQMRMAHLLPNPLATENRVEQDRITVVGEPGVEKRHWDISPPFGKEMVVIVGSRLRLFSAQRPEIESAEAYLAALRERLSDAATTPGEVTADYLFIRTAPKEP